MSVPAVVPSSPTLVPFTGGAATTSLKLGLRAPGVRPSSPRLDAHEFVGLDRLDREELDEDYSPPSRQRVA